MKVGDVVNFVSRSWITDRDYPNPGVIHEIHERRSKWNPTDTRPEIRATVLWSNASITQEHTCYLEVISENR